MSRFKDAEQRGWDERAGSYDLHFAAITHQAIATTLDRLEPLDGYDLLDIGCGTGDLAAAAGRRGARVVGIDFAPTMVAIARKKVPQARFAIGDAEALTHPDRSFHRVACLFCIWHLADPDRAIAEAARVLRPDGIFAYTTWLPPEAGWDMLALLQDAVRTHGSFDVDLPPAPPPFRFAEATEATRTLTAAGFGDVGVEPRMAYWRGRTGDDLLALIERAIVRAPMLIEAQTPEARTRIKAALRDGAERFRDGDDIVMRWPYALVHARRV